MDASLTTTGPARPAGPREGLSYKFQRLRERLRQAITSGELSGKLPGERDLARRFKANPKTLSKALTDLAAEGLLDRCIGRGTFVRGAIPATARQGHWLVLCDPGQTEDPVLDQLKAQCPGIEIVAADARLRPSFLNPFTGVIDLSTTSHDSFHRDLLVRGVAVVLLGREPASYNLDAVLLDRAHAAHAVARELLLAGHRRVLVVEEAGSTVVSDAVRVAIQRYAPSTHLEACPVQNSVVILDHATSAILCDGEACARQVRSLVEESPNPARLSLAAIGVANGQVPCTGVYVSSADLAHAAVGLLREARRQRPTTLWLTGTYVERGTIRVVPDTCFMTDAATPTAVPA